MAWSRSALDPVLTDEAELADLAETWRARAQEPGAWCCLLRGEVLCGPAGDAPSPSVDSDRGLGR